MYQFGQQTLGLLVVPSNLILLAGLIGLALAFTRRLAAARAALTAAVVGLAILGLSPVSTWGLRALEDRFPQYEDDGRAVTGVVVLGGALDAELSRQRGQLVVNNAAERLMYLEALARRYPQARIVFSGGGNEGPDTAEATFVETNAGMLGIPPGRVLFERRSRNTFENAEYSRDLARPNPGERWLLVTSAFHMPRAMGAFRKAGFDVVAFPVDYRTGTPQDDSGVFSSVANGLARSDVVAKEYIGLCVYWIMGKSEFVYPAP